MPSRYNLMTRAIFNEDEILAEQEKFHEQEEETINNNEIFYYSKDIGYRLDAIDHALGSVFYSFSKTLDGGLSFYYISYEPQEVVLNNGVTFNPFDFPSLPYEENGVLNMKIEQGSDGDYNGNSSALYQSKDNGSTWQYIKEIN